MSKNPVQLKRDIKRKKKFLKHLAISSHVTQSARAANIPLSTLYLWRDRDAEFLDDWLIALAAGYELLEMELLHRARNGVEKPVFRNGEKVATVKEYDNGLAFRLLIAHKDMVARTICAVRPSRTHHTDIVKSTIDNFHDKTCRNLDDAFNTNAKI